MNIQFIGVAGTNGSGKDSLMEFLADKYGYLFVSATDLLTAELKRRGDPADREHKAALSAEWRRQSGMGVIAQKAYETWQQQANAYKGVVVGSLRHPGEVDVVHDFEGTVIWVDADPKLRYNRIQRNAAARGRASEDLISFEEFLAQEEREMHPSGDAATLDMASVKERCDIFMDNGSDDIALFQQSIEQKLGL